MELIYRKIDNHNWLMTKINKTIFTQILGTNLCLCQKTVLTTGPAKTPNLDSLLLQLLKIIIN